MYILKTDQKLKYELIVQQQFWKMVVEILLAFITEDGLLAMACLHESE
jgi:hypothetical protein